MLFAFLKCYIYSSDFMKIFKHDGLLFIVFSTVVLGAVATAAILSATGRNYWSKQDYREVSVLPDDVQKSVNKNRDTNVLPATTFRIPILLFHYVEYVKDPKDTIRKSLNTSPGLLDQEIKTLVDSGYTFLTMSDLTNIIERKATLPAKPVILTFDDGYRDFYTDAYPILKKYRARAVTYIVTGFLDKPNNMDWSQVRQIASDGLVEIGAHTVDHPNLKSLPPARALDEIRTSKQLLERVLGKNVSTFAYPYGAFNLQTIDLVKQAGFDSAVSTVSGFDAGPQNIFFLYRVRAGGRVGKALIDFLQTGR